MGKVKLLGVLMFLISCQKPSDPLNENKFDRSAFLKSYAEKFINPGFNSSLKEISNLEAMVTVLKSFNDLTLVQNQWEKAYLAYLKVSLYNFGPAAEEVLKKSLVEEVATFPVNTVLINQKINTGIFSLKDFKRDSRGFLAIEYLIYNSSIIKDAKWHSYLIAVIKDIKVRMERVAVSWETYNSEFISNNGTSAGSSTSAMYNEFLKSFEALKNFKLGLPLGLRPGQTEALPKNVEALYSKRNLLFLKQHFKNLKDFWIGDSGKGFSDYLLTVEGGVNLVNSTELQIKEVEVAFEGLNETDFDETHINKNEGLINLHTELQKLTRFFKSEMSSLLGIAITFSSGDGD